MPQVHVSAERLIPASPQVVYTLLADYHTGHPSILPPAFSDFTVLEGGVGAGTRIRFMLTQGGRAQEVEGRIDEPEPGRVLTERYAHKGAVTTFIVDPIGAESRVRIETSWESPGGLAGVVERLVAPRLFGRLYEQELNLIEKWAIEHHRQDR